LAPGPGAREPDPPTAILPGRVPERNRRWLSSGPGEVRVLEPRYGHTAVGRWLAKSLRRPDIEIKLDELGSAVWEACDGRATVGDIVRHVRDRFGDRIEPAHERLGRFLHQLARNRLIRWKPAEPRSSATD
jgi:hypothetical protein